jgi:hypothetical protein
MCRLSSKQCNIHDSSIVGSSIDEIEVSEFQDFSEELRQPGDVVGVMSQIYPWIVNASVGFESFFSFPVCCFDGVDWTSHGTSPPASPASMSNENACRNRD